MSTNPENRMSESERRLFADVSKWIGTLTVDLSRLAEFGQDEVDVLERFTKALACSALDGEPVKEDDIASLRDQFTAAESVGKAIADSLSASRSGAKEDSLVLPLLLIIAEMAYRHGVADTYRGSLSKETQRMVAASADDADREREAMRELYDDLRVE